MGSEDPPITQEANSKDVKQAGASQGHRKGRVELILQVAIKRLQLVGRGPRNARAGGQVLQGRLDETSTCPSRPFLSLAVFFGMGEFLPFVLILRNVIIQLTFKLLLWFQVWDTQA